jgi:hypothetical protein
LRERQAGRRRIQDERVKDMAGIFDNADAGRVYRERTSLRGWGDGISGILLESGYDPTGAPGIQNQNHGSRTADSGADGSFYEGACRPGFPGSAVRKGYLSGI